MEIDELTLQTGEDIPFGKARVTVHQPTIKEISFIGENDFHIGSHFLMFNKNDLPSEDNFNLESQSNFNIFMSVMNSREKAQHKTDALMILALLFPTAKIKVEANQILLQLENFSSSINEQNFNDFQSIVSQIFCLGEEELQGEYNPADDLAAAIAKKIRDRKRKKSEEQTDETKKVCIYSKYISILSVGLKKDKNALKNYTVYQLRDEFKRFRLKQDFDIYIKAKLAGAQDLEEVDNWMEDIHP